MNRVGLKRHAKIDRAYWVEEIYVGVKHIGVPQMPALLDTVDPDGLLEYSVVFTDRSLNHMSTKFQSVMCDISSILKEVYAADAVALIPVVVLTGWKLWRGRLLLTNG